MRIYWAKSNRDGVTRQNETTSLRWRKHSFAGLAPDPEKGKMEHALSYEPGAPKNGEPLPVLFRVIPTETGFRWEAECAAVAAEWVRGRQILLAERMAREGACEWDQGPGCHAVDLTPLDATGKPVGEAVRLVTPFHVTESKVITFSEPRPGEVTISTPYEVLRARRFQIWQRIDFKTWRHVDTVRPIPANGLVLPIPPGQGAFVLVDGEYIEEVQFYGLKHLRTGSREDYQQLAQNFSSRSTGNGKADGWPLWVVKDLIEPVTAFIPEFKTEFLETKPEIGLRVLTRQVLFGKYLPNRFSDWMPEITIEEFAEIHWPQLSPLVRAPDDDNRIKAKAMKVAFALLERNPCWVKDALDWAGPRTAAMGACLRLIPIQKKHEFLGSILERNPTIDGLRLSRDANRRLGKALATVPDDPETAETVVIRCWHDLLRACESEYHMPVEDLTDGVIKNGAIAYQLNKVASFTGFRKGVTVSESIANVVADWEKGAAKGAGLVERCQEHGLLSRPQFIEEFDSQAEKAAAELKRLRDLVSISYRDSPVSQKLAALCDQPDAARGIAIMPLEEQIRNELDQDLRDWAIQAGLKPEPWLPSRDLGLRDAMESAIDNACGLSGRRQH